MRVARVLPLLLASPLFCAPGDWLVRGAGGLWEVPQAPGNFELQGKVQAPAGARVELRVRLKNGLGYRIQLGGAAAGRLDDPGRRAGVLAEAAKESVAGWAPVKGAAFQLTANGPRLTLRLNGKPAWEFTEKEAGVYSVGALGFVLPAGRMPRQSLPELEMRALPPTPVTFAERYGPGIGEKAPPLRAIDQDGKPQEFASLRGPKGLWVLFFRSADW